jgi:GNAT superfamily N-acetyltransferase
MNCTLAIDITELNTNDLLALRELYLKVRQATFTWFDTSHYQLSAFDTDTEGEYTLVAYVEDKIAGFVSAYEPDNFIHHLYVDTMFQNQGVGAMLLKAMLEKLKHPVRLKCLQQNKAGVAFYERNGFVQKEKGVSLEGIFIVFEYDE